MRVVQALADEVQVLARAVRRFVWWFLNSPWYMASAALLGFAFAAFGDQSPQPWFGFGAIFLVIAVLNAIAAAPKVALRDRTVQARGMFRIFLLSIALLFAIALLHSDFSTTEVIAYGGVMGIFLYFLETQVK